MRNKILKLVLNKTISKKSIILNKKEGSVSSLLTGLMLMTIIIILIMYNFRVTLLSEVFYNIDDTLTASTLGAATPNIDAYIQSSDYPEQGQLILGNTFVSDTAYVNYKQDGIITVASGQIIRYNEQEIVRSELNSGLISNGRYDAVNINNIDDVKTVADAGLLTRLGYSTSYEKNNEHESYTKYKEDIRNIYDTDTYPLKVVNNLLSTTYTNLTQNTVAARKVDNLHYVENSFSIGKDSVIDKTFLGRYLNSDIDITRMEIYNLYRFTLAERHVYASPYLRYKVNGEPGYTWDGCNSDGTESLKPRITLSEGMSTNAVRDMVNSTRINGGKAVGIDITIDEWVGPISESELRNTLITLYPGMIIPGLEPESWKAANPGINYENDPLNPEYAMYNLMLGLWMSDVEVWNNRHNYPLIFWEDTGITCQTSWWSDDNQLKNTYGYLWNNSSVEAVKITDYVLKVDTYDRKLLPIEGYSVFGYVKGTPVVLKYTHCPNSDGYIGVDKIKLGDYNADNTIDDNAPSGEVYTNRKKNADLYYSGIYMEVAFDVVMFPNNSTDPDSNDSFLNLAEFSTQPVTQARLVTLTKKD